MNRRRFLAGSLATAGLSGLGLGATAHLVGPTERLASGAGGSRPPQRPLVPTPGTDASAELAARGHLWRSPLVRGQGPEPQVDVVVVGGGVAGLCAAWRLRAAGRSVALLELWPETGGTALSGEGARGAYPWGAHYVTLPGPDAVHVRRILRETGVITGADADGRPVYADDALCVAPEERLWELGTWTEGLWPEAHAEAEDRAQRDAWSALVAAWTARVGADGRPAFTLPVARCSRDPEVRALAGVSFAAWLDAQGFTAPVLRWWLGYATRDDYGGDLDAVSAWAGLHYFCARRPDPAHADELGTHVLTWPAGNGWLVGRLRGFAGIGSTGPEGGPGAPPGVGPAGAARVEARTGAVVRAVEVDASGVRAWYTPAGATEAAAVRAASVVLAVPTQMARRLLAAAGPDRLAAAPLPDHAPWRVAQLQVSALPRARGVPTAWDSVVYGARSLGYITSTHQAARYGGPAVLTWYEPLIGDPAAGRATLLAEPWEAARDLVLDDLAPSHPDLLDVLERLDAWHWGHGTTLPAPGLHDGRLDALLDVHPRVHLAHTDLSGLSLFEEASWHGLRAAEAALASLGTGVGTGAAESWLG